MGKIYITRCTYEHYTIIFKLPLDSIGGCVYFFITIIYVQIAVFMIIFDPIHYYLVNESKKGEGMFTSAQSRIDFGRRRRGWLENGAMQTGHS